MAIILNDNLSIQAPKSADSRYGPYTDTATAISSVTAANRYQGLVVGISGSGSVVEYWWKDGTADAQLVLKVESSTSNTAISAAAFANAAFTTANNALPKTGGIITGALNVASDLTVTGNLTVLGNQTTINTSSIILNDPLLFLANNNYSSDAVDIGIVGHYNDGANAHTGIFRDPNLKEWMFFRGYTPEVTSNNLINIADPSFAYANVYANTFKGNVIASTIYLNGYNTLNYINASFNTANSGASFANGAFVVANSAASFANGAFVTANSGASFANAAFLVANSAASFANGAFGQANSAASFANSAYTRANNSVNTNTGGTVTGTLTVANTFVAFYNPSYTNWLQATGSNTGNAVIFSSVGGDANVSMVLQPQGNGAIDLATSSKGVNISNGGTVTAITRTAVGTLYTSPPTVAISAPTTAGGVQATATALLGNLVVTPAIVSGGTAGTYAVNDVLTLVGGTFVTASTLTVTAVSAGVITAVSVATGGQYSVIPTGTISTTGGGGTGATFTVSSWGVTTTFTIGTAGSGYVEQPTVTFSGGGGSGAAAYASVGASTVFKSLFGTSEFWTAQGKQLTLGQAGLTSTSSASIVNDSFNSTIFSGTAAVVISSGGANPVSIRTFGSSLNQLNVSHTASAVNYMQITGATTNNGPEISAQGSDASVSINYNAKNAGNHNFRQAGGNNFRVSYSVTTPVNFLQATGSLTTVAPTLSSQGSDTNIDINLLTKGTGNTKFQTANGTQLIVADAGAGQNSVNYLQVQGSNTANAIIISSQGADANVSMAHIMKGNGSFDIQTSNGAVVLSNGGTVTALTRSAAGSGYTTNPTPTISAPTTAGGTQATATCTIGVVTATVSAGGSGYVVGEILTVVGGTSTAAAVLTVATISGSAVATVTITTIGTYTASPTNPAATTSNLSGTGATFTLSFGVNSAFTITGAGSGYVEQPTVTFSSGSATAYATVGGGTIIRALGSTGVQSLDFYTPAGISTGIPNFRLRDTNGDSYWQSSNQTQTALLTASGNVNAIAMILANGTGNVTLRTGGGNQYEQLRVSHTASAVNYVQVTGAATGNAPTISAQGSDADIGLQITAKGTLPLYLNTAGAIDVRIQPRGIRSLSVASVTSAVNYGVFTSAIAGASPTLSVAGTDPNIDLTLTPKGTGRVVTTSTVVAGLISGGTF